MFKIQAMFFITKRKDKLKNILKFFNKNSERCLQADWFQATKIFLAKEIVKIHKNGFGS